MLNSSGSSKDMLPYYSVGGYSISTCMYIKIHYLYDEILYHIVSSKEASI